MTSIKRVHINPAMAYSMGDCKHPIEVEVIRYDDNTFCLSLGILGARLRVDMDERDMSKFADLVQGVMDDHWAIVYADSEVTP